MRDSISQADFDKLLALLDAERGAAGARYEALRERLIKFFEWRDCDSSAELADTVFDRIIRKISEGEEIQNVNAYAATVAQFVFKEYARNAARRAESIEENPHLHKELADKSQPEDETAEQRFECLEKCLAQMDSETRKLLVAYHDADERTMIATRKRLADSLKISLNTLRIRVCRLKSRLENCVRDCCD